VAQIHIDRHEPQAAVEPLRRAVNLRREVFQKDPQVARFRDELIDSLKLAVRANRAADQPQAAQSAEDELQQLGVNFEE